MKAKNFAIGFFTTLGILGILACVCTAGTIGAQLLVTLGGVAALVLSALALDKLGAFKDEEV